MKTIHFKFILASLLFAGASSTSCKNNKNATGAEGSAEETRHNEEPTEAQGSMSSGVTAPAMTTDTIATDHQDGSGAGAQPTVPGGTATGSGTGGNSNQRP